MATKIVSALTTVDNPFDPFDDFSSWFVFDSKNGYNTCSLLSIKAQTSDSYSEDENNLIIETAIDDIVEHDFLKIYKKVTKEVDESE